MKKFFYYFYFLLPFCLWLLIYLKKPDFVVVFKRPIGEESLILPIQDLWQIILVFLVMQVGNEFLKHFFKDLKIFGKIQLIFIFLHLLVVFYLVIFNFF